MTRVLSLKTHLGNSYKLIGGSRPGQARVKFWSIVLIAYHYIVLWDDGAEPSNSKDSDQSKKLDG